NPGRSGAGETSEDEALNGCPLSAFAKDDPLPARGAGTIDHGGLAAGLRQAGGGRIADQVDGPVDAQTAGVSAGGHTDAPGRGDGDQRGRERGEGVDADLQSTRLDHGERGKTYRVGPDWVDVDQLRFQSSAVPLLGLLDLGARHGRGRLG